MRDIHCHILPGVDDGSQSMEQSVAMVRAARAAGVTSMVCTPHCREPYFDYDAMWAAYRALKSQVGDIMPLQMGFEVNHVMLMELGVERWAGYLHFDGSDEFLLELSTYCGLADFAIYKHTVKQLQDMGYHVIIAHPERYELIQNDIRYAQEFIDMGCELQASADFIVGGRFGREKRPAKKMFKQGMYSYIASDAHCVEHYGYLAKALSKFPL